MRLRHCRGRLGLLSLLLVAFAAADHINVDDSSCRNTCVKCGHTWAFDVTDASQESNYCYAPEPTTQGIHRCFGSDTMEAAACAYLTVTPLHHGEEAAAIGTRRLLTAHGGLYDHDSNADGHHDGEMITGATIAPTTFTGTGGLTVLPSCPPCTAVPTPPPTPCPIAYCTSGHFRSADGCHCHDCPTGKYQSVDDQTSCIACDGCPTAEYRGGCGVTSAGSCVGCPKGKYKAGISTGTEGCSKCGNGRYQPYVSRGFCYACPDGKFSRIGHTYCYFCPRGKFADTWGSGVCASCSAGTFQNYMGKHDCFACPIGRYQHLTGLHFCFTCAKGQYQAYTARTFCYSCEAGKFQSTNGQNACIACPTGKYQGYEGRDSCFDCATCVGG